MTSKDVPTREKSARERGTYAKHGDDPTTLSYLSSLFFLLSVPTFIVLAYAGVWAGFYTADAVIPVFAGLLVVSLAGVFTLIHLYTGSE